jgi:poly-gamma-glutamate capsule biosynthesis protein CapA/YwtB (metallophosphatase superfamily)
MLTMTRILPLLALSGVLLGNLAPAQAAITELDIQRAAQLFCDAVKAGKSEAVAQDVATDYLMEQLDKSEKVSPKALRQRTRAAVLKQCPAQAQKIKMAP